MPVAAASAGAAASFSILALLEGPVHAKQRSGGAVKSQVYVWGRAESIPGGADSDVLWPKRIEWFEQHEAGWSKISFGPDFGAALDNNGHIYVWGETKEDYVGPVAIQLPGECKGARFIDVQCSSAKILALTARGDAYFMEDIVKELRESGGAASSSKKPLKVTARLMPGLPRQGPLSWLWGGGGVKQMSVGLEHAAFVTHRGELYCVGGNEWGQCGVDPPRQKGPMGALEDRSRLEVMWPVKVEFPENAGPIKTVSVGGRHTVAMDNEGRTFSFGDDRRIQLGLGDTRTQGIDERNSFGVIRQEMQGGKETKKNIARKVSYRYYDPHMQSKPVQTVPPTVYNRPPYPPPSFIACGEDFTIAMHRDSPDWYTKEQETNILLCSGENGDGQCGRGLQEQQQSWTPVRMPKRSRTEKVVCGHAHCMALMTTGDILAWGSSLQGQLGYGKRAVKAKPIRLGLEPKDGNVTVKNISPKGEVPEYVACGPEHIPFPGKVVDMACGFRNSAVICEVPVDP